MATKTQIGNLALQVIGCSQFVANVDTENSVEAKAIQLAFDDDARDYVLGDFPWPFATAYATLALVNGSTSSPANYDWTFAYRYPADCFHARRIVTSGGREETTPPPFRVGRDSQGRLIYTHQEDAQLEYTVRITDPTEFDSLFVCALQWRLAIRLAPALGRVKDIQTTATNMYAYEIQRAHAKALNEGQHEEPRDAAWIKGR
jgi:hypothetical protein